MHATELEGKTDGAQLARCAHRRLAVAEAEGARTFSPLAKCGTARKFSALNHRNTAS